MHSLNPKSFSAPELTTSMLLGLLDNYKDPRKKIHDLVQKSVLKPIKQGVYVVSEAFGLRPYSKEILANIIYGPSYVSLETALSFYGFIPERVETMTSVSITHSKVFETEIGEFTYSRLKEDLYPHGITLLELYTPSFCQYATPEKALLDFIYFREKKREFSKAKDYFDYLTESYRLDIQTIQEKLDLKKFQNLSNRYTTTRIDWFAGQLIRRLL